MLRPGDAEVDTTDIRIGPTNAGTQRPSLIYDATAGNRANNRRVDEQGRGPRAPGAMR